MSETENRTEAAEVGNICPPALPEFIIEAGQRVVQKDFRVSLKDICEINGIDGGDVVVIYIKKTNMKRQK